MRMRQWVTTVIPTTERGVWLQVVLPTLLALAIFLGTGPELQRAIGSTLTTQAPSIYAAVYGDALIKAPSFFEWIRYAFQPSLLGTALLSTLVALSARTRRAAAFRGAITAAVAITTADVIVHLFVGDTAPLGQSVLFNLLGAPFVWLFFVVLLLIHDQSRSKLQPLISPRLSYPLLSIGVAVGISAIVFVLFSIFYRTAPVGFDAILRAPTEGFFVVGKPDPSQVDRSAKALRIVPHDSQASRAFITSPGAQLSPSWRKIDPDSKFVARVSFYADCPYPENVTDLPPAREALTFDPNQLSLAFSPGMSHLAVGHERSRTYNLQVPSLAQYWLKAEPGKPISSIAAFINQEDKLVVDPGNGLRFYLGAPLSTVENNSAKAAQRQLTITADAVSYVLKAGGSRLVSSKRLDCRAITNVRMQPDGSMYAVSIANSEAMFSVGALVEIINQPVPVDIYRIKQSELTITEANGWVEVFGFDFERMTDHYIGKGRGFSAARNIERLSVDGQLVDVADTDSLVIVGEFDATLDETRVQLTGEAMALWHNSRRLNPTLWERLSGLWQIPLITALVGLIGLGARWLWPHVLAFLREDRPLDLRLRGLEAVPKSRAKGGQT